MVAIRGLAISVIIEKIQYSTNILNAFESSVEIKKLNENSVQKIVAKQGHCDSNKMATVTTDGRCRLRSGRRFR